MATKATSARPVKGAIPFKLASVSPTRPSLPSSPEALPLDGFSRWNNMRLFVPLSRESIRLREKAGRFPQRVYLSQRCAVWPNREIHRWIADPDGYRVALVDDERTDARRQVACELEP